VEGGTESFDPSISGFNGKFAGDALCGEQIVPILFAVRSSLFEKEG